MTTSMCLSVLYSTDSAAVSHDEKQFLLGVSAEIVSTYLDDTLFILTFVSNFDTRKVNEFKLTMYTENIQDD